MPWFYILLCLVLVENWEPSFYSRRCKGKNIPVLNLFVIPRFFSSKKSSVIAVFMARQEGLQALETELHHVFSFGLFRGSHHSKQVKCGFCRSRRASCVTYIYDLHKTCSFNLLFSVPHSCCQVLFSSLTSKVL